MSEDVKKGGGGGQRWFLPDMVGRTVTIRLMDGRPMVNVTLSAFNNYEVLVEAGRGKKMVIFKHAIMTIEYDDDVPATPKRGQKGQQTQKWGR